MITILGPTASGKTRLAGQLAYEIDGEIISADSRQVYRGMDIGTGKDYSDYIVKEKKIPYHLVDMAEPGTEFNVFQYQQEFLKVYKDIKDRSKMPVLCGGTGLYLESILKGYKLTDVPHNAVLREELKNKSQEELIRVLSSLRKLHNITDSSERERTLRAIEIETYHQQNKGTAEDFPSIKNLVIGIHTERPLIRKRITQRLEKRLNSGMIEEVKSLLGKGLTAEKLKHYGLEYKFLTMYILGEMSYEEMFSQLNTAIHQFAKRQMTWFRKMERSGIKINWIDGTLSTGEMLNKISDMLKATGKKPGTAFKTVTEE